MAVHVTHVFNVFPSSWKDLLTVSHPLVHVEVFYGGVKQEYPRKEKPSHLVHAPLETRTLRLLTTAQHAQHLPIVPLGQV
jgi:hypothetical protein